MTPESTLSVRRQSSPSMAATAHKSSSRDGGVSSRQTSTSACSRRRSVASPGSSRVTNTRAEGDLWPNGSRGTARLLRRADAPLVRLAAAAGEARLVFRIAAGDLVLVHAVVAVVGAQPLEDRERAEHALRCCAVEAARAHGVDQPERYDALIAQLRRQLGGGVSVCVFQRDGNRLAAIARDVGIVFRERSFDPRPVGRLHLGEVRALLLHAPLRLAFAAGRLARRVFLAKRFDLREELVAL